METHIPAVVAVVVTTGSGPGLEATLASLVDQDYGALSVLVVANGENDSTAERVAGVAPNAYVKVLEENRGFGSACNEAALMVTGTAFFLFCHDDLRLAPDAVSVMVEAAYRTNAGIVTPKYVNYDDPMVLLHVGQTSDRFGVVRDRIEAGEIDHGQQDLERDVFVAPGGATLIRADLFATLRGFDPMIMALGEDLDLCWRAQEAGARIIVTPAAKVAHRESIARGERAITAIGARRTSRQTLQRRHQLLVVATGWSLWLSYLTLLQLLLLDVAEIGVATLGRDPRRVQAIIGSWRWLAFNRRRLHERRKSRKDIQVLSDHDLRRLQVAGASRVKEFAATLAREGFDTARGIFPERELTIAAPTASNYKVSEGVGFAAAFSESEEFDDVGIDVLADLRSKPAKIFTSFRSQILLIAVLALLWFLGVRNLLAMHLPLVGRLVPLDSWWSTWRHFFSSWSPNGVGTSTPASPGYGLLAFAGTFVFGRMGILPRLAMVAFVPTGAIGVARMLKGKTSNRARLLAAAAYLALPIGFNMIGQGRIDVLAVSAGLPYLVRRLFELLNVPVFSSRTFSKPVPFGHHGWRTSRSGQRMVAVMLTAAMATFAPAVIVLVLLIIVGVAIASYFDRDDAIRGLRSGRFAGGFLMSISFFLLPVTVDLIAAGSQALTYFGLPRGAWSNPTFLDLVRGADGNFGGSWWNYLLPAAALGGLLLVRDERRQVASKVGMIGALTLLLTVVTSHGWLGAFTPDVDVLMVCVGVCIALLIGLGISGLELDLAGMGFGWRQIVAALTIVGITLASIPMLVAMGSGRFDLPTTSVAESLGQLSPSQSGGFRVLWIGDPSVLPIAGWSVAPGVAVATSTDGLPGGSTLFGVVNQGASSSIVRAVQNAMSGNTVQLGSLLAQDGISTVVVMNASSENLAGIQTVPVRPVPNQLLAALNNQTDLSLELSTGATWIYSNTKFSGIVTDTLNGRVSPVFSNISFSGPVMGSSTVHSSLSPAGDFALRATGTHTTTTSSGTWAGAYKVSGSGSYQSSLVLSTLPWNGLLALFTFFVWAIVWLGFGWIQRLEWLFTIRQNRKATPRHARQEDNV